MKDEYENEMNTEWNKETEADRAWLRDELKKAGEPALPASLSAAALFARMDAEDAKAKSEAETISAAPVENDKKKALWVQWRRWGSIAAVLVLAVGVTYLLQSGALTNKHSVSADMAAPENSMSYGVDMMPDESDRAYYSSCWEDKSSNQKITGSGEENPPAPNPSTAGGSTDENPPSGYEPNNNGGSNELQSKIISVGEQPIPDMMDFDAMAAVASQLFGGDYEQAYAMFYDSGERWTDCPLPASCAHYFLLDKTLYGFFPEESRVVNYSGTCTTVLNEDEAAMLSAILRIS